MTPTGRRRLKRDVVVSVARIVGATLASTPFLFAGARAETVTSGFNSTGSVGYSSNPYLLQETRGGVLRGEVSLSPSVEAKTARSSLSVSSNIVFTKFSAQYRDAVNLSTLVGYTNTLTRQLSLRAGMSITSALGGTTARDRIFDPAAPTDVVPNEPDITLVGFQSRTTRVQGSAALSFAIDNKNSLTLAYNGGVVRLPGSRGRSEYANFSQSASYSRVLNSRLSGGGSVNVSRVNYFGGSLGDAVIISPSVNASLRLASKWTLSGGIGFSTSRINVVGGELTSTNLSGSLSACRSDSRTNFCLNGSRSTGGSSFNGIRTTSSIGTSYSYKINGRDTITASGGYSRSSTPQFSSLRSTTYLSGTTTYARRFSSQISGQLRGGFTRSTFEGTRSNAFASIGINYNFGDR